MALESTALHNISASEDIAGQVERELDHGTKGSLTVQGILSIFGTSKNREVKMESARREAVRRVFSWGFLEKIEPWSERQAVEIINRVVELGYEQEVWSWIKESGGAGLDSQRVGSVKHIVREMFGIEQPK